jgi:hypothetical protein
VSFQSRADGVAHPANRAIPVSFRHFLPFFPFWYADPVESFTVGVGHPVKSLTYIRWPEADWNCGVPGFNINNEPSANFRRRARSAQIGSPDGISKTFQFSAYSSEPYLPKRACNLIAKAD